ncbi:MAG: hypothetical protein US76_00160 [Parcubacteria group bacterium GW2011_GWA2_38_13b]|nr:MAG: hypothetical protein US76_00160 [Parcubacteria group bacterium GW2011_GWA2_38_13b]
MAIDNLFLIIVGVSNLILGFLIYFNNKKSLINRVFGIWTCSLFLWSVNALLFYVPEYSPSVSLVLGRFLYETAIIIVVVLLYFVSIFPFNTNLEKLRLFLIFTPSAPLLLLTIGSDLIIQGAESTIYGNKVIFGPLFVLYAFFIISYLSLSIFILAKKYKKNSGNVKVNISYILAGIIISGFLGIMASIVLPLFNIFDIDKFGSASTIVLVFFVAYAVAKHNFMDIKVIGTEFFAIVLSFILFIDAIFFDNFNDLIIKIILFVAVASITFLLVKSVVKEVRMRQKLEELTIKLRNANEDLKKLDAAKSEFISIASHQLRTPLSIIKGYVSVMVEGDVGKITDQQKDYLRRIYTSNEKLIMLVKDLLDLSRIESGRMVYDFGPIPVFAFTENIVEELRPKAVAKNLTLKFNKQAGDDPFVIYGDKNTLTQALFNIVDNSIRYTEQGKIEVNFTIDNKYIVWSVKDTGAGISGEEKKNLFQKMQRGERISRMYTEGTGLGLYVVKKIIDAHNGSVWAESDGIGKGSIFYIKIPIGNNRLKR